MNLEVDNVGERGTNFSKVYQIDELPLGENDVRLVRPAAVSGRIRRHDGEVRLTGELDTEVEIPCGRCLKPVRLPIQGEFSERFLPAVAWRDEEQHELKDEDLNVAIFTGEVIDLDDVVRQEILLAVPGHVLCNDNCQGLCPACGVDRNVSPCSCEEGRVDSRWEKLRELQM